MRDSVNGYLENLFLHPHKGLYLAFLMRYKFSKEDMGNLNAGIKIKNLIPKLTIQPFDLDINIGDGIALEQPGYTTYGDWHAGDLIYHEGGCWYINHVINNDDDPDNPFLDIVLCTSCTSCLPKPD
ncbi:MAG: hypothetical protein ACLGH8_07130 [Bacteroidia bacterium]